MAAPLLQRLTEDGSLETPPVIENPFEKFPLCSQDLYRRMGVKKGIFLNFRSSIVQTGRASQREAITIPRSVPARAPHPFWASRTISNSGVSFLTVCKTGSRVTIPGGMNQSSFGTILRVTPIDCLWRARFAIRGRNSSVDAC